MRLFMGFVRLGKPRKQSNLPEAGVQSTDILRMLCRPLTARDYGASAGSSAAASGRSAPSSATKGRVLTAAQGNVLCRVCLSRTPWLPAHKRR